MTSIPESSGFPEELRRAIEQDRPGSYYARIDLSDPVIAERISAYQTRLLADQARWLEESARYQPQEAFPGPYGVQLHLLDALERGAGTINFAEVSCEPSLRADNTGVVTSSYEDGCRDFVINLGLDVRQVPPLEI